MNREIIELRAVIQKLVPMLTGRGLRVTQMGAQAYVTADPKTNRPVSVNIPSLPDNATADFVAAVAGFVDHEVAHVLFTDWAHYGGNIPYKEKFTDEGKALTRMHNIIEDTMIEREIVKVFPGSVKNLDSVCRHFLAKITTPALASVKGNEKAEFGVLVVPMMRALSGQQMFQDFMDQGGYWKHPLIENLLMAMSPEALALIKTASSTKETYVVAEEIHDILFHRKEEPEEPEEKEDDQQSQQSQQSQSSSGGKSENDDDDGSDGEAANEDQGDDEGEEGSGTASGSSDDADDADEDGAGAGSAEDDGEPSDGDEAGDGSSPGEPDESAEDDGAGFEGDDEEGDGDEADGDSDGEGDDDAEGEDTGAADDDGDEDGEADGEGDSESDEAGEDGQYASAEQENEIDEDAEETNGSDEIDGAGNDDQRNGGNGSGGAPGKSMFDIDPSDFQPQDLSSAIAEDIANQALAAVRSSPYSVFTRDEDRIEPLHVDSRIMKQKWVVDMDEAVQKTVGPMQKQIERLFAARSRAVRVPGYRSGRIHASSLWRLPQGDPRVFARKEVTKTKETAVTLLVDNSGSMTAYNRIKVAMESAYALAQVLERVDVACEILGFTTGDLSSAAMQKAYDEKSRTKVSYSRYSTIVMPVYKAFDERVTPTVKQRMAYMINTRVGMNTNTDGESLEYAAQRLIPRKEVRKVMIVLSDGQPVGDGGPAHLKQTVQKLGKMGIETIGIGIQSNAVSRFYDNNVVLNDVSELPSIVMGQLSRILLN